MIKPGAIIIGGHFQGLGVIRALARENVRVLLMDKEPCLARFSRYVERFVRCPDVREEEAFIQCLLDLAWEGKYRDWVIFATDDETVFALSRNRERLSDHFNVTTPEWESVKYAYNKRCSYQLAEKLNIPIPMSAYPDNEEDLEKIDIPFPLIIKPAVMRQFFRVTGKKVFRARDRDELFSNYRKAADIVGDTLVVQEELPEVSKHLFSFCPMFADGEVLACIIAQRLRQHPMDFGQASTYALTVKQPELQDMGKKILSAMNFHGICEVEFIEDPRDGKFKFLEVNPRIWGWHTLAIAAGVNLPYYNYLHMTGRTFKNGGYEHGVKWMRLLTDVPTVLQEVMKGRMSLRSYSESWKGKREFAVLSRRDPIPFIAEICLLPYLWKKRGF